MGAMLHTNDEFLRAIEADPREGTLRLAYADWLTEHDDPRGELIRVEEEMRALPVFADRFWELKPRRNQLRAEAGGEWCARMRYGTECLPVFAHGIPDGWRERWRLIREFTERWHQVPMPDVGGRQAEIAEAETRLGRTLPPSVREFVAFTCDHRGCESLRSTACFSHDFFFMEPLTGQPAVSLAYDGSIETHRAVRFDAFDVPDPVVQDFRQEFDGPSGRPLDCRPATSAFFGPTLPLTDWVLWALFQTLPYGDERLPRLNWVPEHLRGDLDRLFPQRLRTHGATIGEAENLLIQFFESGEEQRLRICYARNIRSGEIPKVLADAFEWFARLPF